MTAARPQGSRNSSNAQDHRPTNPSGLRQAYTANSPPRRPSSDAGPSSSPETSPKSSPYLLDDDVSHAGPSLPRPLLSPNESTALLQDVLHDHAHPGPCTHGTFSPRAQSPAVIIRNPDGVERSASMDSEGDMPVIDSVIAGITGNREWRKKWARRMRSKKMSTSSVLAERAGFQDTTVM
jgi:hypothetical protein